LVVLGSIFAYQYYNVFSELQRVREQLGFAQRRIEELEGLEKALREEVENLTETNLKTTQELERTKKQIQELEEELETLKQESEGLKGIIRVAIIVEGSVASKIKVNLNQYITDIELLYINVRIGQYQGNWTDPILLRTFIQNLYKLGIKGVILVGKLPYALWEFPWGEKCPLPFYYEDLDGIFEDKDANGVFDYYNWGEKEGPEIWVSWIRPDSDNVTGALNDYLEKLHNYYRGNIHYQNKALVCVTKDWGGVVSSLTSLLQEIYPEVTSIGGLSISVRAEQYLKEYVKWYELTDIWSHASSDTLFFDEGTTVSAKEIKSLSGGSKITFIWGCHAGDFHEKAINNLASSYVFDNNFGLASLAATRSIGIEKHEIVIQSLGDGKILGEAFFDWITFVYNKSYIQTRFPEDDINRFMWDFILIGDPFVLLDKYQNFIGD